MGAIFHEDLVYGSGGSGHVMLPNPDSTPAPTEDDVVDVISAATATSKSVASLFGIQKWSNMKCIRLIYTGTVGHYGIGTWKWDKWKAGTLDPSTDEADWWQNDYFKILDTTSVTGYDTDFKIKFEQGGEVVTLGGYMLDTTTGKLCIKFANYLMNPSAAKIMVDITLLRTDVGA